MGASCSSNRYYCGSLFKSNKSLLEQRIQRARGKIFLSDVVLTSRDLALATRSWEIVLSEHETDFSTSQTASSRRKLSHVTTLTWFYDEFYEEFFSLCPEAKPLFANVGIVTQGRILTSVISNALESLSSRSKVEKSLRKLVMRQNHVGVRSEMYGKMGEALLCSLATAVGPEFDHQTRAAWIRIYSSMLNVILPIAVGHEINMEKEKTRGSRSILSMRSMGSMYRKSSKVAIEMEENGIAEEPVVQLDALAVENRDLGSIEMSLVDSSLATRTNTIIDSEPSPVKPPKRTPILSQLAHGISWRKPILEEEEEPSTSRRGLLEANTEDLSKPSTNTFRRVINYVNKENRNKQPSVWGK